MSTIGVDSLQNRVYRCKPEEIELDWALNARDTLGDLELEVVKACSEGAVPFYIWV